MHQSDKDWVRAKYSTIISADRDVGSSPTHSKRKTVGFPPTDFENDGSLPSNLSNMSPQESCHPGRDRKIARVNNRDMRRRNA